MSEDYILEMMNINKSFPGVKALDNATFQVKRGETHCLIGANGAGKSTLIKVLSGAYHRDDGKIIYNGEELGQYNTIDSRHKGIAIIYQELSLVNCLSVAENIYLNDYPEKLINWKEMNRKAKDICERFNITVDVTKPVSSLSIGQKQLVEIMKALSLGAKVIVMDEPSATLSEEEFNILLDIISELKKEGITIIYISHRLDELYQVGDRVTIMLNGQTVHTGDIKDLSMDQLVELMIGRKLAYEKLINNEADLTAEPTIKLDNATSAYVGPINFEVHRGEVFGLYGLVGSGRTEVLRMIYGVNDLKSGKIIYEGKQYDPKSPHDAITKRMGLVPENRKEEGLVQIHSVWENATLVSLNKLSKQGILNPRKLKQIVREYIDKLSIKTPSENTICRELSGGNQQKVVLSRWLILDCDLLLIDEPTQGIDVGAKDQIYRIIHDLVDQGKTVIIVSSELDELVKICNRIAVMYEGKQIHIFDNNTTEKEEIQHTAITGRVK